MKNLSFILNAGFILLFIFLGEKFKEDIIQKWISKKGRAPIVLFGDSLIKKGNWNDLLDRNDVKNSGISGFTTSHLRMLINKEVIRYKPEICFLEGGINDIGVGIPIDRIKINYQCLIDTLISNGIVPVVQSTIYQVDNPESKVMIDSLNSFLVWYCKSKSIKYLDINSKLSTEKGLKPEFSTDGTHLTKSAYVIWKSELENILNE